MSFLTDTQAYLTNKSNYLVNWHRVGNLLFTNHRYSPRELLERSFVIASTAAGGFLAWNKSEEGGATPFALGASLAFVLSHTLVISPLIYKRLHAMWNCDTILKSIGEQLAHEQDKGLVHLIQGALKQVMTHVAEKSPSAVWGKRLRLLTNLQVWLDEEDPESLRKILTDKQFIERLDKNETRPNYEHTL
jgi:hypothetical protein